MLHTIAKHYHKLPHEMLQSKLSPLEALSIDNHVITVGINEETEIMKKAQQKYNIR